MLAAAFTAALLQEYGKQSAYRRGSLVVLAALEDIEGGPAAKPLQLPAYMRDKTLGYFMPEHKARVSGKAVLQHNWYNWASMVLIGISIIAVVWTPNSSQEGPDTKVSSNYYLNSSHSATQAYSL